MISDLLVIGGFVIALFFGLVSIPPLRIYFRTGIKGLLFVGFGLLLEAFGFLGITVLYMIGYFEEGSIFLFLLVAGVGLFIAILGTIIGNTSESGLVKEFFEKTTFWQRMTGNVPILKYEKTPPPSVSKRTGLIFGISAITFGSLLIILNILFKIQEFFIHFFITATFAFIIGLLLVIFSVIYLDKGKESPK